MQMRERGVSLVCSDVQRRLELLDFNVRSGLELCLMGFELRIVFRFDCVLETFGYPCFRDP